MAIGSQFKYNAGDLILHQVSQSGTTFIETKITASANTVILYDSNTVLTSSNLSNLYVGTASIADSASYALNSTPIVTFTQSISASTWTFIHNLGKLYPIVTVYDTSSKVIIPAEIQAIDTASLSIQFNTPMVGYAVAAAGTFGTLTNNTDLMIAYAVAFSY